MADVRYDEKMNVSHRSVSLIVLIFLLFAAPQFQIRIAAAGSPADASEVIQSRSAEPETHLEAQNQKPETQQSSF